MSTAVDTVRSTCSNEQAGTYSNEQAGLCVPGAYGETGRSVWRRMVLPACWSRQATRTVIARRYSGIGLLTKAG